MTWEIYKRNILLFLFWMLKLSLEHSANQSNFRNKYRHENVSIQLLQRIHRFTLPKADDVTLQHEYGALATMTVLWSPNK